MNVKSLIRTDLADWQGSFELFQNEAFLQIKAYHENLEVMKIGSVLGIFSRKPLVGIVSGFIGNPEVRDPEFGFLKELYATGAAHIRLHTYIRIPSLKGFQISPHDQRYYIIIDASKTDAEILKSVKRQRRQMLKKSVTQNLSFKTSRSFDDVLLFYELCNILYRRGTLFDIPSPEFMMALIESGFAVFGLVSLEGVFVGGSLCLCGEKSLHCWILCIRREFRGRKLYAGDFMYLNIIKWARENGFKYLVDSFSNNIVF